MSFFKSWGGMSAITIGLLANFVLASLARAQLRNSVSRIAKSGLLAQRAPDATGIVRYASDRPGGDYFYLETDGGDVKLRTADAGLYAKISANLSLRVNVWFTLDQATGLEEVANVAPAE